jgi:hypothetical protein
LLVLLQCKFKPVKSDKNEGTHFVAREEHIARQMPHGRTSAEGFQLLGKDAAAPRCSDRNTPNIDFFLTLSPELLKIASQLVEKILKLCDYVITSRCCNDPATKTRLLQVEDSEKVICHISIDLISRFPPCHHFFQHARSS